jgi:protein subunit release factor A
MSRILVAQITKRGLRIDTYRGSGAGGQHRNKTDSCVRITHIDTGITGQCCDSRSQSENKKIAFERLCQKLVPILVNETENVVRSTEVVRTYNERQDRVRDHRTGKTYSYKHTIGKGNASWLDS